MNKIIISIIIYCLLNQYNVFSQTKDECFNCHNGSVEDKPGKLYSTDLHFALGISCAGCHGGNSKSDDFEIAMSKKNGFIGIPSKNKIVDICLNCHLNQTTMKKYGSKKSVKHLEFFKESVHYKQGVATCITCHGIHKIKRVNNRQSPVFPTNEVKLCSKCHSDANYMKTYNPELPTDQYDKYLTSIHGIKNAKGDVKAATCSDCHSPHNIFSPKDPRSSVYATNVPKTCSKCHSNAKYMSSYNIPTDQYDKYTKSVHGIQLIQKHDVSAPACNDCHGNHGAIPVGVKSISHICGTCHVLNADLFSQSPHADAFEKKNIPQCEACHSNHLIKHPTDEMLGTATGSVCIKCHKNKDDGGFLTALYMKSHIDSILIKKQQAIKQLDNAEGKGMDVSDYRYSLKDLKQNLIEARTITHKSSLKDFKQTLKKGSTIVNEALTGANSAIDDYYFRRWGLGGATLIITFLVIILYWRIKRIEKNQEN